MQSLLHRHAAKIYPAAEAPYRLIAAVPLGEKGSGANANTSAEWLACKT